MPSDKEDEDQPLLNEDELARLLDEIEASFPTATDAERIELVTRLFKAVGPVLGRRAFRKAFPGEDV